MISTRLRVGGRESCQIISTSYAQFPQGVLLVSDVGPHLIVVPDKAEMEVSALRQKENAQIQSGAELKIFPERTQPDTGMQMWPTKHGLQPRDEGIHRRRLFCCQ